MEYFLSVHYIFSLLLAEWVDCYSLWLSSWTQLTLKCLFFSKLFWDPICVHLKSKNFTRLPCYWVSLATDDVLVLKQSGVSAEMPNNASLLRAFPAINWGNWVGLMHTGWKTVVVIKVLLKKCSGAEAEIFREHWVINIWLVDQPGVLAHRMTMSSAGHGVEYMK